MTNSLYPEISPYKESFFQVDGTHALNIREFGNADGIPVLVHHGGPGAGCPDDYARFFDPQKYYVVLYDQRGAGKSTPAACLKDNNCPQLVEDVKSLMEHLGLEKALMFGGSWGSTLPILFAEKYPEKVTGLILRGIFLGREQDISAFLSDDCEAAKLYPKEWQALKETAGFAADEHCSFSDFMGKLAKVIRNDDEAVWLPVATQFTQWEVMNSCTDKSHLEEDLAWASTPSGATLGRTEIHFMADKLHLTPNQLLDDIAPIRDASYPIYVVHGKQDVICPILQADAFVEAIGGEDKANVTYYRTTAGHSCMEPGNIDKLVEATNLFAADYS